MLLFIVFFLFEAKSYFGLFCRGVVVVDTDTENSLSRLLLHVNTETKGAADPGFYKVYSLRNHRDTGHFHIHRTVTGSLNH